LTVTDTARLSGRDPNTLPGLYYPYIHIRDADWLKGAVLAFQQVRRIVPNRFTVKDGAITRPYSELVGPRGRCSNLCSLTATRSQRHSTA
jgi:hypothetical protein